MDLKKYFSDYAKASNEGNVGMIAGFYSDEFVVSSPKGSGTFRNDRSFRDWIQGILEFNRTHGMRGLDVLSVKSVGTENTKTRVEVRWKAIFLKDGREITSEFDISYVLDLSGETPKIVSYYSHEDQEDKMKDIGIL